MRSCVKKKKAASPCGSCASSTGASISSTFGQPSSEIRRAATARIPFGLLEITGDTTEQEYSVAIHYRVHDPATKDVLEGYINQVEEWLDVRKDVQDRYNEGIQRRMKHMVWQSGCNSWYLSDDGSNHSLYPGPAAEYVLRTRFRSRDFETAVG